MNHEANQQLFAAATLEASSAMSRWTRGQITLTLDDVIEAPIEDLVSQVEMGDSVLNMVVLTLEGELGGTMVLAFDDENGRQLAADLLQRKRNEGPEWSEVEISALNETGNILSCAYLNALQRTIGAELIPSPPAFLQDFGGSVLEQVLMQHAMDSDQVTLARVAFDRVGSRLNWHVFFVPTTQLRRALGEALHTA